jgi:uncharacterized protein (TIGR03067 family)
MNKLAVLVSLTVATVLATSGCSTPQTSTSKTSAANALDGSWSGREIGAEPATPRHLIISGTKFDFRGADPNDWGKGTITMREDTTPKQALLTLTECGPKEYTGKTCGMIYKLEDGTLTAAASEPGNTDPPSSFDAAGARQMVFKRE